MLTAINLILRLSGRRQQPALKERIPINQDLLCLRTDLQLRQVVITSLILKHNQRMMFVHQEITVLLAHLLRVTGKKKGPDIHHLQGRITGAVTSQVILRLQEVMMSQEVMTVQVNPLLNGVKVSGAMKHQGILHPRQVETVHHPGEAADHQVEVAAAPANHLLHGEGGNLFNYAREYYMTAGQLVLFCSI